YLLGAYWMRILIASFGFDIDYVASRIISVNPQRVVLLALYTTEEAYSRIEKAFHMLSVMCKSMKIDCKLEKIDPKNLHRSVYTILEYEAGNADELEIYLTGGPRILVATLLLVTLLLPSNILLKTKITVEGEGFNCRLTIDPKVIVERMKLDNRDKMIISKLDVLGKATLSEIARVLENIPRSTIHRRLKELEEKGLIYKMNGYYAIKELLEITCS
ncbi:MAG: CRISPR-associated CARF protein Csa3, partial [Thermoprotei archaeon]